MIFKCDHQKSKKVSLPPRTIRLVQDVVPRQDQVHGTVNPYFIAVFAGTPQLISEPTVH